MKYNFDQVTDRSHTDATKWYVVQETLDIPDVTPLWIADMDFAVSDPIQAALKKRMECPAYGCTELRSDLYAGHGGLDLTAAINTVRIRK